MRDISYKHYVAALAKSHTGKRLAKMLPVPLEAVTIVNASPKIGTKSQDAFPADLEYLQEKIAEADPDVILAFGSIASDGLEMLGVEYYQLPHPARRDISVADFASIRESLESIFEENTR